MRLSSRSRCVPIVFVVVFMTVSLTWPPGLGIPLAFQTLCAEDFTGSNLPDTGVSSGLIVHLGCGDGRLTADLHASNQCLVHGLDADPANVKKARQYLRARGLRGTVSVDALRGSRLPYADNLVNLVVAHDLGPVPMSEVNRALVPGGVAYVKHSDGWQRTVKTRSADLDEWTHWLHDPSGNAVARDQAVGPPRRFQWKAAPLWSRHHNTVPSVSAMVSANGRVFTIVDEAPPAMAGAAPDKWFLVARDAFNGIELWRKPITDWGWRAWSTFWNERFNQPNNVPKRLVAVGDRIYVTLGFNAELTALDAATGDVVQRYEGTDHADEILYQDGLLILSVNKQPQGPGKVKDKPPVKKYVTVLDAKTGNELWRTGDFVGTSTKTGPLERVTHLLLAAIGNQVFVLDEEEVVSLDLDTGEELWCSPRPRNSDYTSRYHHRMSEMCTLVATEEVVLLCQLEPIQKRIGWRVIKARLQAYDTKTGDPLWQYRCGNWGHFCVPDVFVTQGLVWVHDKETMSIVGLEPETGVEQRRVSTKKALDYGHHHRCYRNKATDRYLLTSYRGVEFIDWTSGDVNRNHWVRGTCRYGVMPCNGLLYSTPHPCDCYITSKLNGFYALAPNAKQEGPDPETKKIPASDSSDRLETGPAYDNVSSSQSETGGSKSEDWPMYRHDAARTGCASGPAPSNLTVKWKAPSPGGPVSAPVVSGDHVLIASVAFPTIHALDAESGAEKWSYLAGGGLDTPPTVWDGRVIFGGRDGWVYCLRLSDGALIWRFHAAPTNRLVVAHGSLESAWPLNGSVLVRDGKVYAVAGRSSFLDGGLMAYCLDASTGKVLDKRRIAHQQDMPVDTGRYQNDDTGVFLDLLVSEGRSVYMRHVRVFGSDRPKVGWGQRVGATAGMLDDSWFNRTLWLVDGRDQGELLVHDEQGVYCVRVHESRGHGRYIEPGTNAYRVVATDRKSTSPKQRQEEQRLIKKWPRPKKTRWSRSVPVRVTAMAVGGNTLLCAGTPDKLVRNDPWAAYEGRRGGVLFTLATSDGADRGTLKLDAAPVYDGMAVAHGRLYLSTVDGTLHCIGD
ncbi:MAG: PQQ-binding-like beta-propeller repeat protein [Planctomycetota bacterium]